MESQRIEWKFQCTNCGYCCRFEPGFVFLTETDLKRLALYFELSVGDFIKTHCREVFGSDGSRISLKEKKNNDCEFWSEGCTIYEARPNQCRAYPFWPNIMKSQVEWDKESEFCPGIGRGEVLDLSLVEEKSALRKETLISFEDACRIS